MAGDWIKVEKATPRKPEVLRCAEMLGIHADHAFGLCLRFWMWCDDQLENGHAPSVTNVTLDMVVGHAGFSTAMVTVGWLVSKDGRLEIPNFDRHLSKCAKKRALEGERKRKQRNVTKESLSERDIDVTEPGPEKRRDREEKNENKNTPIAGACDPPAPVQTPVPTPDPDGWSFVQYWFHFRGGGIPVGAREVAAVEQDLYAAGFTKEQLVEELKTAGHRTESLRDYQKRLMWARKEKSGDLKPPPRANPWDSLGGTKK